MTTRSRLSDIDQICETIHNLQKSLECTICLELITDSTKTRCGHSFCKSCIGRVLRTKNACCPLCKKNLNRRNISKDDDLQIYIEKFKDLVTAIQKDTNIEYNQLLSHSRKSCDTKESSCYPDSELSSFSSNCNKEKRSEKAKSSCQLNQSADRQTDKPSTSRGTMIDRDNSLYDSNKKPDETSSILYHAVPGNDKTCDTPTDIKIRTWLSQLPNELNTGNSMKTNKISPIEDKVKPINSIVDDNSKSDEMVEVYNEIDTKRRSNQDRKRSMDVKYIDEDDTLSPVNKEANQINEVIEIDSSSNELKYKAIHARVHVKENARKKNAKSKSNIEETANQDSSSSTTYKEHPIAASAPLYLNTTSTSAIAEQSTANWSRVIEFGKEMKRAKKRKVKKLNISTEKNRNPPRIIENIVLTPNSKYDSIKIVINHNKNTKEANVSNQLKSSDQKQDAIDKSLNLSDAKVKALNNQTDLFDKDKTKCSKSTYPTINTSYIALEEDRQIGIINLNSDQMNKNIDQENAVENLQNRDCEENTADYNNLSLSWQKRLMPKKLNVHEHEIIHNVSQTSTDNFRNLSHLSAEKRIPGSRDTSNVQETSNGAVSSQLQFLTPNKADLSLKRKGIGDNKSVVDSPSLNELPLSYRVSIGKDEEYIGDRKNVNSPILKDNEMFNRLKIVRRDLNFKIRENQQKTDQDMILDSTSKSIIDIENNNGKDRKLNHNLTNESTVSKYFLTKSQSVENQRYQSLIKFVKLGSFVRRLNVRYFYRDSTKREQSMPAEVRITPVYNTSIVSKSEIYVATSPNPWNDSQNLNDITMMENIFADNLNSNKVISKEFPALQNCTISATSTPQKNILYLNDSHLNQKKNATIICPSTNVNQRSDKSVENIAKKDTRSLHKTSHVDTIHGTISDINPGTSKSIKLLSPDKDSQLKFLEVDSPSEREKLRRASSIKSIIKENNFSEMKSSRLEAPMPSKAQKPFIENLYKKRKRTTYANDRELFEDRSDDNDSSNSASDSSRSTIKLDRYNELSQKMNCLDENKKRRLSSSDDDQVEVISVSKKRNVPRREFKTSDSDTEPESVVMCITKNLKSDEQCAQQTTSITDSATKKCSTKQDLEDLRMRNIIDKWSNEHNMAQKKLMESKISQNSVESIRTPPEENPMSQLSHSSSALKMEKHKNLKPSQKSSAKESDMFESSNFFNSENIDYILQQSTQRNANDTSRQIASSSNDDIISKVLQIDRSRSNTDACKPPYSAPRNDIMSQREKDSTEYLLQDNFNEIIANIEQPQSEDFIPCTERLDRNSNSPLAKQKMSNCLVMTDESCGVMQETPIMLQSSTNDMFTNYSRNVKELPTTNNTSTFQKYEWIIKDSDKKDIACSQKRHDYVNDQRDKRNAITNADEIGKDFRKTVVSKHNISREKEKFEEHDVSIQSTNWLDVDDNKMHKSTVNNESISKDIFNDSLMNSTQHQARLQMFEQDLFGIVPQNQIKATEMNSQNDSSEREQHTPKQRKNTQNKNTEPGERFADEDDVVENTPEKKMNSGNTTTLESRESTKKTFLTPLKTAEQTLNTSASCRTVQPFLRSGASTPTNLFESYSQNTIQKEPNKMNEHVRSGSILLAKQVNAKIMENVRWQPDKRNLRFVCSSLSASQIATVKEFAAKYNAIYVNQFDHDVTHVIVKTTGKQNLAKSTLKYLQGIAHQKWLVSYKWIEDCNKQQRLLDEIPYEATTQNDATTNGAGPRNSRLRDKGLFEDFTFLCVEPYDNVSLDQYQDLLRATGATVVDSFEALAKVGGLKGIVIQDNFHDDKVIEHWYRTAKAAPILVDWIVECIGHYKLFKLAPYVLCLSPQDFCAIGYPWELMEEDEGYSDNE